jgi:predicted aldo/keto reductase-like oxidoreductase
MGISNNGYYLTPDDLHKKLELDRQVEVLGDTYCTGCFACLPCPENINIPEVLRFRNMWKAWDMETFGKYRYNMLESKGHWFPGAFASACTECGDCLPRCPVKLPIPTLLKETHEGLYIPKQA